MLTALQSAFGARAVLCHCLHLWHTHAYFSLGSCCGLGTTSEFTKLWVYTYLLHNWSFLKTSCSSVLFSYGYGTNDHKRNGLKQHKCIVLQFWRLKGSGRGLAGIKRGVGQVAFLLEALGVNPFPWAFRGYPHFMAGGLLPPSSKPAVASRALFDHITLTFSSAFLFHTEGALWLHWAHPDYLELSPYFKASWSATLISSPWPCKVTYSQVLEVRTRTTLEVHYSVYHKLFKIYIKHHLTLCRLAHVGKLTFWNRV